MSQQRELVNCNLWLKFIAKISDQILIKNINII